jgi:hypothetical protein
MILTIDAGSRATKGSMIVEAWKHGVEVESLNDNLLELSAGQDERLAGLIKKFPSVKILHQELVKEVSIYE